ncbi:MAG: hypothetical protein ACR2KU_03380 [Gammaproteobacteria bacterium]
MKSALVELLAEVRNAYEALDIKTLCLTEGLEWNYSLVTTSGVRNAPLIVSFNWGAASGKRYRPQERLQEEFLDEQDPGSLVRILPYLKKYLPLEQLANFSQTNYCFFRSHKANQISARDLALCQPLFTKLLAILKPGVVLSFSSKLRDYIETTEQLSETRRTSFEYLRGGRRVRYSALVGKLHSDIKAVFLPHPNYPLKGEVRDAAWGILLQ